MALRVVLPLLVVQLVSCLSLPRVIFSDCDGTMLAPDHRLTERTRQTLRRLAAAGIPVIPATGRAFAGTWVKDVLTEPSLKSGTPGIYMNGGCVIDETGTLTAATLPSSVVSATVAFAISKPVTAAVYSGGEALVEGSNDLTARLASVGDAPVRQVGDLNSALESTNKILLLFDDNVTDGAELRRALEGAVGKDASLTQALSWMLEVVPLGVNKATAARMLLKRWDISAEDAMAIGDGENDVELLSFCGQSIAMGNGAASAKATAQYLAPANSEDGFSAALEELVLSQVA